MSINTLLSSNIIVPIIVAFIGFLIAVTTAVIAKEHKVSEFRQAWIDQLREDLSNFYAINKQLDVIRALYTGTDKSKEESIDGFKINQLKFDELFSRISLRLNWDEHKDLKSIMSDISTHRYSFDWKEGSSEPLEILLDNYLGLSKDILSIEWKVVKRGESLFLKFKYVSKLLASTFLIATWVLFSIATLQSDIFQW